MPLFDKNYAAPSAQARAVRAYLDGYDGVEPSYNKNGSGYEPVNLAEWHNGRERGYVVMFRNAKGDQLNIAFFEHRNSDQICALAWVQQTLNPPTIQTAKFGNLYRDKYDVSHSVDFGQASQMAAWIYEQLCNHWEAGK